jgi:hypothetical protein
MTDIHTPRPASDALGSSEGKADVAREQASLVADTAKESGLHVVDTAKVEAANVLDETKGQARELLTQTRAELKEQAGKQQVRVAAGLRSVSDEFGKMAGASESGGMATDWVRQAASKSGEIAEWLDQRDPGSLLEEVKAFARRRPGAFIAAAAVAGVLAGRLTRSIAAEASDSDGRESVPAPTQPHSVPVTAEDSRFTVVRDDDPQAPEASLSEALAADPTWTDQS